VIVSKLKGWWAYQIDNGKDVQNFNPYDSDQNFQIEMHYQLCLDGYKKFGSNQTITGDAQGV
jgi:hypothetical protein